MELTSRAIGHELVAIVESRMHEIAKEPWLTSELKGPKTIDDIPGGRNLRGDALLDALANLKEVSKLKFDAVLTFNRRGTTASGLQLFTGGRSFWNARNCEFSKTPARQEELEAA